MMNAANRDKRVIGAKQVRNAIEKGMAVKVYVASDCDPRVSGPIIEAAEKNGPELFYVETRKELGQMFGLDVKASCAAEIL